MLVLGTVNSRLEANSQIFLLITDFPASVNLANG